MTTLTSPSPSLSPKASFRSLARQRSSPLASARSSLQQSPSRSSPSPSFAAAGASTTSNSASASARRQTASLSPSRKRHASSGVTGPRSLSTSSSSSSSGGATAAAAAPHNAVAAATSAGDGIGSRSSPVVRTRDADTADAGTQYTPPGYPPTAGPRFGKAASGTMEGEEGSARQGEKAKAKASDGESNEGSGEGGSSEKVPHVPAAVGDVVTSASASTALHRHLAYGSTSGGRSASDISTSSISSAPLTNGEQSPQKKQRSSGENVKVMAREYALCDVKDLGVLISDMLLELIRLNDRIPLKDGILTRFHSRAPPTISVSDYLNRIIIHATLSPPLLLSMVYYIDRLCSLYPAFTISSLTVHRFLITAATVAAKGLSDSFWTNHTYARVGGVSTKELAMLELEFLGRLEWKIVPQPELLDDYYRSLVGRMDGYVLQGEEDEKMTE